MKNRFPYSNDAAGDAASIRYESIMKKLSDGQKEQAKRLAQNSIGDYGFMPEWVKKFRAAAAKAAK